MYSICCGKESVLQNFLNHFKIQVSLVCLTDIFTHAVINSHLYYCNVLFFGFDKCIFTSFIFNKAAKKAVKIIFQSVIFSWFACALAPCSL